MDDRRLSADEVARFHRDGYLHKPALFDAEEVALMRRALASDGGLPRPAQHDGDARCRGQRHHDGAVDRARRRPLRRHRALRARGGGAERLLGGEVYHYHSKLTLKAPETGGAWNWHQDYGYWYFNGNLFPDMLSVFIAIDPATEENGCLRVIRGSARMGRLDHELVGGQLTADPERVAHAVERLDVVACEMAPATRSFSTATRCTARRRTPRRRAATCCSAATTRPATTPTRTITCRATRRCRYCRTAR